MTELRSPVGAWSKRTFWGVIGALVALGVALLAVNGPFTDVRSLRLVTFVDRTLPLLVAVLAYNRVRPAVTIWEIVVVATWGYVAMVVAGVAGFFLLADLSGTYPGETREMVETVARFLFSTAAFGGLYALAAAARDRPVVAGATLLLVPVAQLLRYAVV